MCLPGLTYDTYRTTNTHPSAGHVTVAACASASSAELIAADGSQLSNQFNPVHWHPLKLPPPRRFNYPCSTTEVKLKLLS